MGKVPETLSPPIKSWVVSVIPAQQGAVGGGTQPRLTDLGIQTRHCWKIPKAKKLVT
jgi:hypothetical protein